MPTLFEYHAYAINSRRALRPPFPAFAFAVPVLFAAADDSALDVTSFAPLSAEEVVAAFPLAVVVAEPFPPFPAAEVAVAEAVLEAASATAVSTAPGPAATAEAARAAAASPVDPSFEAALTVVPEPETTNLVQSSEVPR